METLRGVFPTVPTEALLRVLEICDQSVAVASAWLVENNWHDLMSEADAEEDEEEEVATTITPSVASTTAEQDQGRTTEREENVAGSFVARCSVGEIQLEEEFDSEEEENEEDEDEDEDEEEMDDDGVGRVPPLMKRVKVSKQESFEPKSDDFWVAFDDQVVIKSMIELLNTTLSKLAHSKVVLLNQPAKDMNETAATVKLRSILSPEETMAGSDGVPSKQLRSSRDMSDRITLASLLNGGSPSTEEDTGKSSKSPPSTMSDAPVGQKRKRNEVENAETSQCQGFYVRLVPAYFFPVKELDMVWRTVMHAHLFKGRFGEKIEFHTASSGPDSMRDFDELMHIQNSTASSRVSSLGLSPLAALKCCLILPCPAEEEEIFRVGKNIHSMLKVQGSLYYQVLDGSPQDNSVASLGNDHFELLGDDEKLTEVRFRQFARYRVKEDEEQASKDAAMPSNVGMDPYMSYQQPRKVKHCLQILDSSKWGSRLSG